MRPRHTRSIIDYQPVVFLYGFIFSPKSEEIWPHVLPKRLVRLMVRFRKRCMDISANGRFSIEKNERKHILKIEGISFNLANMWPSLEMRFICELYSTRAYL